MPFENTPENAQTGTFEDSTVTEETEEVWIEHDGKAYGFVLIPEENVSWKRKSEAVENAVGRAGFSAVDYYEEMLQYQVKETSFGAEERLKTWLTSAADGLVEQLEEHVPDPVDAGEDQRANAALDLLEEFVEVEDGDLSDPVSAFREFAKTKAEGEQGK